MKNMNVKAKLLLGFLISVALCIIVGGVGLYGIYTMNNVSSDMYENRASPLGNLATGTEYFQRLRVQTRNAILYTGDTTHLQTVEKDMSERMTQFESAMDAYAPSITTENGKKLYESITTQYTNSFKPGILDVLDSAKQGVDQATLLSDMAATTEAANIIADSLSELTDARMNVMSEANQASNQQGLVLLILIIVVILVAAVVSIVLALYIANIISNPLIILTAFMDKAGKTGDIVLSQADTGVIQQCAQNKDEIGRCIASTTAFVEHLNRISEELQMLAAGDLTVDIDLLSDKDTMGMCVKKTMEGLNSMFAEINMSTAQVTQGSKQLADGSQALAQGSTEQAAAVEQLSSSITEIAHKTKENAAMAERAAHLAETIKGSAEKGSHQMDEMMSAVREINQASQNINKVIKVIDDIAFQTNILALNAAVEAARAGQHGKGFAVVAEEVRNLAAKSAEAAKDTGGLIANSMEKAELGARIADETAASLEEIVSGINESTQLVAEIARSSEEQSDGISQINKGIDQVAQVIQQNSATAEQSAAASDEMSGQAHVLEELVAQFKLRNDGNRYAQSTMPAAPASNKKQLTMPAKSTYAPDSGNYGKY